MTDEASGFLARWARRKDEARAGSPEAPEPAVVPDSTAAASPPSAALVVPSSEAPSVQVTPAPTQPAEPAPTMADVQLLTRESDFSRFAVPGVDPDVKRAAMKKLFSDPHFNVMDGLDTYIDDYGKPDPLPLSMLRRMNQAVALGLFAEEPASDAAVAEGSTRGGGPAPVAQSSPPSLSPAPHCDAPDAADDVPDLRLQQDDAAGPGGPEPGART